MQANDIELACLGAQVEVEVQGVHHLLSDAAVEGWRLLHYIQLTPACNFCVQGALNTEQGVWGPAAGWLTELLSSCASWSRGTGALRLAPGADCNA